MGFVFSKILGQFSKKDDKEVKIVMIGLNNAGKTTLLYKMNIGEVIQTAPSNIISDIIQYRISQT